MDSNSPKFFSRYGPHLIVQNLDGQELIGDCGRVDPREEEGTELGRQPSHLNTGILT